MLGELIVSTSLIGAALSVKALLRFTFAVFVIAVFSCKMQAEIRGYRF